MTYREFRARLVVHRWDVIPTPHDLLTAKIGSLYVIPLGIAAGLALVVIPFSLTTILGW